MIPPYVQQIVGVFVRTLIVAIAGYMAAHAGVTLNEDQIAQIVTYVAPIVAVVAWSLYSKYIGRQKLLTAAGMAGKTEHQIEATVKDPAVANPSVNTAKTTIPLGSA